MVPWLEMVAPETASVVVELPLAAFQVDRWPIRWPAQGPSVGVQADLLRPSELFQLTVADSWGKLTLGRVLIPFGTFDTHHLYGGRADEGGTFLPKLWTDWGVIYSAPEWGFLTTDLYVTNGMDPTGFASGGTSPRIYAPTSWDSYGPSDALLTEALAMGGLDVSYEFDSWILRAGGIVQQVRGTSDYLRWADYGEVGWKITWDLTFRVRAGQMDTNSLWITAEDQANVNVGLVWKTDFAVMYFRNFTLADTAAVGYDANYHQILFKVLVAP